MSKKWNPKKALVKIKKLSSSVMVCDALMDQKIFAGVGNIIKNEVLFQLKMHPENKLRDVPTKDLQSLIKETRSYSLKFYKWKKQFQLKKNWKIFRKKICPDCKGLVTKCPTGIGERLSHFCEVCQH